MKLVLSVLLVANMCASFHRWKRRRKQLPVWFDEYRSNNNGEFRFML